MGIREPLQPRIIALANPESPIPTPESPDMSNLLWQKPGVAVDTQIQAFLAGDDVILDREFFLHDIAASTAHAEGLQAHARAVELRLERAA